MGSKVEDVYRTLGPFNCQQHGIDTVLNVQVTLTLPAVAQNLDGTGVGTKLLEEIQNVTVGVSLSQNRNEPKNMRLKPKS